MDHVEKYRDIVERVLTDYSKYRYAHGDIERQTVFDRQRDHYLIVNVGWDKGRVHGCSIHIDIINGKCWIQLDGSEHCIATDLLEAGIPKDHIVLGFKRPEVRKLTEFAVS
jgi:XisI protein